MTLDRDRWQHRRRRLDIALVGHGAGIAYLIGWGADNALHRATVDGLITSAMVLLVGYIVTPVADDFLQRRRPDVDPS